jgi:branched-chain amino acid aminotransferase
MVDSLKIDIQRVAKSKISDVNFESLLFGKNFSDHMFVADYKDGKWTNLKITPFEPLTLSPGNSALHYGQSIFEGLKAYINDKGEALVFRPLENFKRMNKSAERMCMAQLTEDVFMSGLTELIALDKQWIHPKPGYSLYIRPLMFATDEFLGVRPSETYKFIIMTGPAAAYYSEPVKVKVETYYSRSMEGGTGFAKTAGNYAGSLYPAKLAYSEGYHQLLWTDAKEHKYFEESGTMNVMFVVGDTIITPPAADTILKGITRDSVLTLLRDWGLKVEERKVSVAEIMEAIQKGTLKEAFGVGTAATITHIATIGYGGKDYNLPDVKTRELSVRILKALDDIKTGKSEDKFNWIYKI